MNLQNEKVMALWWKQPYATAMLHNKVETRTWNTNVRGKVLICSTVIPYKMNQAMGISGIHYEDLIDELRKDPIETTTIGYNGFAIAIGDLVDCRPMMPEDAKNAFVEYNSDLYCHFYENVRAIKPFEMKGCQGWRILTEEQKKLIEYI